jgi:hypothetical protein
MQKSPSFFMPLTVEMLERRVVDWRQFLSLGCAAVVLIFGLQTADRTHRGDIGFAEYLLVGIATVVVWHFLHIFLTRKIFPPNWHRFELYPNEVIFARKGSELIVIRTNEEIKNRVLDGCSDILVIKTEPWFKRPFDCSVGRHKMTFLLSLKVVDPSIDTVEKWVSFSESEILREFRDGAKELASQLGVGRALESPHEFAQLLTECLNRRLFSIIAVQIEVSPTADQEDLHASAEEALFG